MTKKQIESVIATNQNLAPETVERIIRRLKLIIEERDLTKQMYFWRPGMTAKSRRAQEEEYNIYIEITDLDRLYVRYDRDFSMSCAHVYASDKIEATLDGEEVSFSVADCKKFIDALAPAEDKIA